MATRLCATERLHNGQRQIHMGHGRARTPNAPVNGHHFARFELNLRVSLTKRAAKMPCGGGGSATQKPSFREQPRSGARGGNFCPTMMLGPQPSRDPGNRTIGIEIAREGLRGFEDHTRYNHHIEPRAAETLVRYQQLPRGRLDRPTIHRQGVNPKLRRLGPCAYDPLGSGQYIPHEVDGRIEDMGQTENPHPDHWQIMTDLCQVCHPPNDRRSRTLLLMSPKTQKAEILATARRWADAFNQGDAVGCAKIYADDAELHAEPIAQVTGRANIQKFWQQIIEQGHTKVRYLDPKVELVSNDRAILSSPWSMNLARGMIHREEWQREKDNVWRLKHDHFEIMDQFDPQGARPRLLLIHGAWMGAWCWQPLQGQLEKIGIMSNAIDLPAHGASPREPVPINLETYVDATVQALQASESPLILLGHSFSGLVISRAAERCPEKIRALVYLSAFLVPDGASFLSSAETVQGSEAIDNLVFTDDRTYVGIRSSALHAAVAHDVPKDAFEAAASNLVPEPCGPLSSSLNMTRKKWGRIPRYYIECTEDRAVPIAFQRAMQSLVPIEKTYALKSSHSPMFSQPEALAQMLREISDDFL